ncbi:23S rRNA (cytidine(2498)-2'-O)-methyltransferase, partial [hydrothermal vent metagenome]
LPMKKRFDMVMQCQRIIESELNHLKRPFRLDIKHLYHDREEVTCMILLL